MKQKIIRKIYIAFMLMICPLNAISQSEDFFSFLKQFSSDSLFRSTRTQFPLEIITWDLERDEEVKMYVDKDDSLLHSIVNYNSDCSDGYFFVFPDMPLDITRITIEVKGVSDVSDKYWFVLLDGKWYLIRYRNYDLGY